MDWTKGSMLVLTAGIIYALRDKLMGIINWVKSRVIVTVRLEGELCEQMLDFLAKSDLLYRPNSYTARVKYRYDKVTVDNKLGLGLHFGRFKRSFMWFSSDRTELKAGYSAYQYELTISTFIWNRDSLDTLIAESTKGLTIHKYTRIFSGESVLYLDDNNVRGLSSIVISPELQNDICDDLKWFLDNREWYIERGLNYQRGYLLTGKPGNGKTSLVKALCKEFGLNIHILDLNGKGTCNQTTIERFSSIRLPGALILEDFDKVYDGQTPVSEENKTTFDVLLNCLDGALYSPDGLVIFYTANNRDAIDSTLQRPGRIDRHFEIDDPSEEECVRMYRMFFNVDPTDGFLGEVKGYNMAQIQEKLVGITKQQTKEISNANISV